jgi:hypothetical protein
MRVNLEIELEVEKTNGIVSAAFLKRPSITIDLFPFLYFHELLELDVKAKDEVTSC